MNPDDTHPSAVSFVVPVHNGAAWIGETLASILRQADGRPMEIVVVDDPGDDGSSGVLRKLAADVPLRILEGPGRGAAAAVNAGIRAARFPIICQVDQDVVLQPGWMRRLTAELDDPHVAAAQGQYTHNRDAGWCARVMGLDLEQRYAAGRRREVTQVCTGNSAYRASALRQVGLFDESLGYGYDNDMSYRLREAGYRLAFCPDARSMHRWRDGLAGYLSQQYGFGYGRIDLVAKHPRWVGGDSVAPAAMMAHPLLMLAALVGLALGATLRITGGPSGWAFAAALALIAMLMGERLAAGVSAALRFRTATALLFPVLHLLRDLAWVAAVARWSGRRLLRHAASPSHSMRSIASLSGAPIARPTGLARTVSSSGTRVLGVIPAHNEAESLPSVVAELRACAPHLDLLVVDDGSTDGTATLLPDLDVRWLRLPDRMGVGSAMRAGLRYAARLGYQAVVRVDGDGQHRADEIERLLTPICTDAADVVLGSRYTSRDGGEPRGVGRLTQRVLGWCISAQTGRRVTDPTSGFCALGARAIGLLAEHHPTGYPEPELRLFLSRNALRAIEVPVLARPRLGGASSLTPARLAAASARVLLAIIVVPLRGAVGALAGD